MRKKIGLDIVIIQNLHDLRVIYVLVHEITKIPPSLSLSATHEGQVRMKADCIRRLSDECACRSNVECLRRSSGG